MKLQSFLFCDDIRTEANGKTIIIGVYDIGILLPKQSKFPIRMPSLGFFCRFNSEPADSRFDEISLDYLLNGKSIASQRGRVTVKDISKPVTVSHVVHGINLSEPGSVEVVLTFYFENKVVGSLRPGNISIALAP